VRLADPADANGIAHTAMLSKNSAASVRVASGASAPS
jgi:hypothetical protein